MGQNRFRRCAALFRKRLQVTITEHGRSIIPAPRDSRGLCTLKIPVNVSHPAPINQSYRSDLEAIREGNAHETEARVTDSTLRDVDL